MKLSALSHNTNRKVYFMTATEVGGKINIEVYWTSDDWLQTDLWVEVTNWEKRIICPRRVDVPKNGWQLHVDFRHYYGKDNNFDNSTICLLFGLTLSNKAGKIIVMDSCTLHARDEVWQSGEWLIQETASGHNLQLSGPVAETFVSSLQIIFHPCFS